MSNLAMKILRVWPWLLVLLACGVASFATVRAQFDYIAGHEGASYIQTEDYKRHAAKINGTAHAPYRFRILTDGALHGLAHPTSETYPRIVYRFRLVQNTLIFALTAALIASFGCSLPGCVLGIALLAYGMQGAFYQSDVSAYTYSGLLCFLMAALAINLRRDWWIIPLSIAAATNREEAVFLPVMLFAVRWVETHRNGPLWRQKWAHQAALAFIGCVAVLVALRMWIGDGGLPYAGSRYGDIKPGLFLLSLNWDNAFTWRGLYQMFYVLPAALLLWKVWPATLKAYFIAIAVPIGAAQFLCGSADETRLFLVPLALVAVPAAVVVLERVTLAKRPMALSSRWRQSHPVLAVSRFQQQGENPAD